jgi:hypothetical protein
MKQIAWLTGPLAFVGIWAGLRGWEMSASTSAGLQAVAAVLIGVNLASMTWMLRRARPASGDFSALPPLVLLSTSMLVGLVPRLLWPDHDGLEIGTAIASIVMTIVAVVWIGFMMRRTSTAHHR